MTSVFQHWFYMLEHDMGDINAITWPLFRSLCQQRFGPPLGTNHLADLARLPFRGSVSEYQEAFQSRMAHTGSLTPEQQVQLITRGLPDPIRTDVELQTPSDLQCAMLLARACECRSMTTQVQTSVKTPRLPRPSLPSQSSTATNPTTQVLVSPNTVVPSRPLRRLTPSEMTECRRQGLCYNCHEQYVGCHKCPRLLYLEVSDYDKPGLLLPDDEQENEETPLIALHAITGIRIEDTMQLKVGIGNHQFTTLVDSRSTHSFISAPLAQHVGLHCQDSRDANVTVANGDRVACCGLARDVALHIDCYTIPLDCYDMVLGVSFLRTLGPILWDFDDLCMTFWRSGKRVLWKGVGSTRWDIPSTSRLHSVQKSETSLLDRLLESYSDVFEPPTGLPPQRSCDHMIHLLPDALPVAVRPYTYPQIQKDELESQCATMLEQGIIRPST